MRVALLQFAPAFENRLATRQHVEGLVDGVDADWILLPEMALTSFTMNAQAATWSDDDFAFFARLARERRAFVTVGGVSGGQNCAFTFDSDGKLVSTYRKNHLFSISGEDSSYRPGPPPEAFPIAASRTSGGSAALRVAPAICYDLRFPYHFWNLAPEVTAYFVIAAWPGSRRDHWRSLLAARAIENQAFVIGVNRVGSSPDTEYSGDSAIFDPRGRLVIDCGSSEGAFVCDLDPREAAAWRDSFGTMKDRLQ